MKKVLFYKESRKNLRASVVNLGCVFMIALLTGACASEYKKQISFEIPPLLHLARFPSLRMKLVKCLQKLNRIMVRATTIKK
jgi:hypothetical protein